MPVPEQEDVLRPGASPQEAAQALCRLWADVQKEPDDIPRYSLRRAALFRRALEILTHLEGGELFRVLAGDQTQERRIGMDLTAPDYHPPYGAISGLAERLDLNPGDLTEAGRHLWNLSRHDDISAGRDRAPEDSRRIARALSEAHITLLARLRGMTAPSLDDGFFE